MITERVQRAKETMHVMMMRQSNSTVRYMFLAAEGTEKFKLLSPEKDEHLQTDFFMCSKV